MNAPTIIKPVLPLGGLRRAGLLSGDLFDGLIALGLEDLVELGDWSRADLTRRGGLSETAIDSLEALLARYCLSLARDRRRRFRRPGRLLDPY